MEELRVVKSRNGLLTLAIIKSDPLGNPAFIMESIDELCGKTIAEISHKITLILQAMDKPILDKDDLS